MKARREGLITQRAERRAARSAAHENAVGDAIIEGLHDAYAATCPDTEYYALADRLIDDAREYLDDADEMRGYLDRPVGETVAKLCDVLGLAPEACQPDGETWRIRRPPLDFEVRLEERAADFLLPLRHEEGQTAKPSGWGTLSTSATPVIIPHAPHPDRSAICSAT